MSVCVSASVCVCECECVCASVCVCVCVNGANLDNLISRDSSDVLHHLRQVLDLHLSPVEESVQVSCGKEGDRQLVCVCVCERTVLCQFCGADLCADEEVVFGNEEVGREEVLSGGVVHTGEGGVLEGTARSLTELHSGCVCACVYL